MLCLSKPPTQRSKLNVEKESLLTFSISLSFKVEQVRIGMFQFICALLISRFLGWLLSFTNVGVQSLLVSV